jgi:mRNA interferase RelE/StbE
MQFEFTKQFEKGLDSITDAFLINKIDEIINTVISADKLSNIPNIKKLKGYKTYYRIRVGDYRIGLRYYNDIVCFVIIEHRKDIYKRFP